MPKTVKLTGDKVKELIGITPEKEKYMKCWNVDAYRKCSPGEESVDMFLEAVGVDKRTDQTLIDFGCGTGRAAMRLDEYFDVTPMDFAANCLDEAVDEYFGERFVEHDITERTALRADWGYCTDVMEHLPPEQIDDALTTVLEACDNAFFQIATIEDHFGGHPDIDEPLHLTVKQYDWWLKKFQEHGCRIHRSQEDRFHVVFLVSGYGGFSFDKMRMNTDRGQVFKNIRENLARGLQQLRPFEEQVDQKVVVLGAGPSLNDYVDEIKEHKKNGAKIVTLNGTYGWAKEHGLWPVTQFMIDARPFNSRFVEPVDEGNVYVIASQCAPELFDKLPPDRTWIFQCNLDPSSIDICNELIGTMYEDWFPVCGGSTVMMRALPALLMMGFRDVEIYGFDSCLMGRPVQGDVDITQHHAFDQPENDLKNADNLVTATLGDIQFAMEPWMLCQVNEFLACRRRLLGIMDIKVHGDGIIAFSLERGFDLIEEDK